MSVLGVMDLEKIANHIAMAHGYVVLDENLAGLAPALNHINVHTIQVPKGTSDLDIIKAYVGNRILITQNSKDFQDYASSFDFGIIALDGLVIDTRDTSNNKTTQLISKIIIQESLQSKRHGYIVKVKADGTWTYKDLVD